MTYENVSNWLISNFGDEYLKIFALPIIVFIVLTILGRLFINTREFMVPRNKGEILVGFFFGFASGITMLFLINYFAVTALNVNPLIRLQNFVASVRI